ncbi:Exoribonuclease [Macleaya cordata]|uniref:Exoribonuclease n=1 Tax=Macleaya cordata TaxID=56857 RepID=A0A200Q9Q5_MACCD|nr:Exoribonuclease [Macleaya cordata]
MASLLGRRTNPFFSSIPILLKRRRFGLPSICSTVSPRPLSSSASVSEEEYGETFKEEFEVASHVYTFETRPQYPDIVRFANASVVMATEGTKVFSAVARNPRGSNLLLSPDASAKGDSTGRNFLLSVDYQENQFGHRLGIPHMFMRRKCAPRERELVGRRIIERAIRPLFPAAGFKHQVDVMAGVLSSDGKLVPDVMAANATSAALMLSKIPWGGPIGVVRVGLKFGDLVVMDPFIDEFGVCRHLDMVYACTKDRTLMIDVQADPEFSEIDLKYAIILAHNEAQKYLEPQIRLAEKVGNVRKYPAVYGNKVRRGEELEKITQDQDILEKGVRIDGRRLDEVRPLRCESGNLSNVGRHGSSLFSLGDDTQVLCRVVRGDEGNSEIFDDYFGAPKLHYMFPPFSINEFGKCRENNDGLNSMREFGERWTLAEKALLNVLPLEEDFNCTVRVNSQVMASDDHQDHDDRSSSSSSSSTSTSMATVCGTSMALMDDGIISENIAGVSMGLVSTCKGLSAIQLDIQNPTTGADGNGNGIPVKIILECLEPALKALL